ncbi:MAG: type III PLP-dependent enzyme [Thioploca sp.]|nr:type III PLP-dependent enzyme [Thioploca sp.]
MNELLIRVAGNYGTPCFVYQMDVINQRIADLRIAFGNRFKISYAVKSNPNPVILQRLQNRVDMLDISSSGELIRARQAGWSAQQISFTGPGKQDRELQLAVNQQIGQIVVESVAEAQRLNTIAQQAGIKQPILVRISPLKIPPGFGINMAGKPNQFGIDEEDLDPALEIIKKLPFIRVCGFHIYSGTQCLQTEAIIANFNNFIDIFQRVSQNHQIQPEKLIFGAGFGIPYHDGDQPLNLIAIANQINPALDELQNATYFAQTHFILEMGRYLVGEAGLYLTRIINQKKSRGTDICICDGGMNHHLAACGHFGTIIPRNYRMFKVMTDRIQSTHLLQDYDLFGPLCSAIDRLGHHVKLPPLAIGDIIAIQSSGAYGLTASPLYFISHPLPQEILIETQAGQVKIEAISQSTH